MSKSCKPFLACRSLSVVDGGKVGVKNADSLNSGMTTGGGCGYGAQFSGVELAALTPRLLPSPFSFDPSRRASFPLLVVLCGEHFPDLVFYRSSADSGHVLIPDHSANFIYSLGDEL